MTARPAVAIRDAAEADLPAILAIYNHAVLHSTAIFNETPSDLAGRRTWWAERTGAGFPVIVADVGGTVAGYATYGPFRPHQGYRHTCELSIYVDVERRGAGIGSALMAALVDRAMASGVHVLVGGIEAENAVSLALHARHGFTETGRMPEVAVKFGRWLDLVFMQRVLDDRPPRT